MLKMQNQCFSSYVCMFYSIILQWFGFMSICNQSRTVNYVKFAISWNYFPTKWRDQGILPIDVCVSHYLLERHVIWPTFAFNRYAKWRERKVNLLWNSIQMYVWMIEERSHSFYVESTAVNRLTSWLTDWMNGCWIKEHCVP